MKRPDIIVVAVLLTALLALFTLDLRHTAADSTPKIFFTAEGHGQLLAGAGQAEIHVPYPVVPAGYGPKDRHEVTSAAQPQMARAIALQVGDAKLTLVSVDLLEIDSQLLEDLKPRLPSDAGEIWVCATHTHSGMGNYDPNLLAQIAGTGRFKKAAREALMDAIVSSTSSALHSLQLSTAFATAGLGPPTRDRSESADPVDSHYFQITFAGADLPIAQLWNFAAHPTLVPRPATQLSSDFPGAFPARGPIVEAFFQSAVGNVSIRERVEPAAVAEWLDADASQPWPVRKMPVTTITTPATTTSLAVAVARDATGQTEIHAGPGFTRRASSNLVDRIAAPHSAQLSVARLGPLTLIAVPGEPTAAAGRALREAVGDKDALILGLCNGYVGYIETPDRVAKGIGEAPRQYYDASLLSRFTSAASLAGHTLGLPTRN